MQGDAMQLYSFFNSSTSYRVRIALALKGQAYDYHGVNIRIGEEASAEYLRMNPGKGVPLLIDDEGHYLGQSLAIMSYLDELYPEPRLIPADPLLKARVLELANVIACDIHPINNLRVLAYLQRELDVSNEQKNAWYQHWIAEGFTTIEALLSQYSFGQYCFGDAPTLADCCLVPQVANAQRMNCDLSPYPLALKIHDACMALPAFQQAAPQMQADFCA